LRIAINGFGRIGRLTLRAILSKYSEDIEIVAINDLTDVEHLAHLLKYDSNYGRFPGEVTVSGGDLKIDSHIIKALSEPNIANLPWSQLKIDVVIEATGRFTQGELARGHIESGAKKVLISAPAKSGEDLTLVMGVNEEKYDPENHHVLSNASCTTNCLAPVAKILNDNFTIVHGLMTTVHAYTISQNLADGVHSNLRRGRAAAINIIPTTTGAAEAVAKVLPELQGKLTGMALRVPVATVSVVDLSVNFGVDVTAAKINSVLKSAADGDLKGVLGVSEEELVSSDFREDSRSSIVDALSTTVIGDRMAKVIIWYDNEWGYASRTADAVAFIGNKSL
jgi:glyceraldehyde 3-phosphate dehydrogenase